ncbi:MAG TPA: ABC transporter permease [Actinomycetes bacterium]
MFLALRELKFARGRFLLMGSVVALIAVLSVLLSGMSSGLVRDGISGLRALPATHFAFESGVTGDLFSRSVVQRPTWQGWAKVSGVKASTPYGNLLAHATSQRGDEVDLALFGVEPGSFLAPQPKEGSALSAGSNGVLISQKLLDAGIRVGDTLTVDRVGTKLQVVGTVGEASFGHVGVVLAPLTVWQEVHYGLPGTVPATAYDQATAVALQLAPGTDTAAAAADQQLGTHTITVVTSYAASPGYTAETATMTLIRLFLYLISALVVGAFFTVWTVQRRHEIALVKALGGSSRYLLRDAAAQVLAVLVGATVVGALVGVGLGALIGSGVPFSLEAGSVLASCLLLVVLGLVGALGAVRRVTAVDPLIALGGNR